jgi:ketosteroid isomerase-like protein
MPDGHDSGGDSLEARIQKLEDLLAIHELFIAYGRYLDAGDVGSYAKLFAEDGDLMLGPVGRARGRQQIEEMMSRTLRPGAGRSYHLVTGPIVQLHGDKATAEVMWTVLTRGPDDQPILSMTGRHQDDLVRTSDGWKFQRRRGYVDIPGAMK